MSNRSRASLVRLLFCPGTPATEAKPVARHQQAPILINVEALLRDPAGRTSTLLLLVGGQPTLCGSTNPWTVTRVALPPKGSSRVPFGGRMVAMKGSDALSRYRSSRPLAKIRRFGSGPSRNRWNTISRWRTVPSTSARNASCARLSSEAASSPTTLSSLSQRTSVPWRCSCRGRRRAIDPSASRFRSCHSRVLAT